MQETLSINEGILHKQVEHTPSEEIFLNEVRIRGSPTINFAHFWENWKDLSILSAAIHEWIANSDRMKSGSKEAP